MAIKQRVLPLALAFAFLFGSTARAEPTPAPTVSATMSEYQSAMTQYRLDLQIFNETIREQEALRKTINRTFTKAVLKANANLKKVMRTTKHATAMRSANAARDVAIMNAITERDLAIAYVATPPVEPIKPVKPEKVEKVEKVEKIQLSPEVEKSNKKSKKAKP